MLTDGQFSLQKTQTNKNTKIEITIAVLFKPAA